MPAQFTAGSSEGCVSRGGHVESMCRDTPPPSVLHHKTPHCPAAQWSVCVCVCVCVCVKVCVCDSTPYCSPPHTPVGSSHLFSVPNTVHNSCSLEVYLQTGQEETRSNMLLELTAQIIAEPCFDILRTKEQLGTQYSRSVWYTSS